MLGRLSECYQPLPSSVIYPSGASTGVLRPRDTFSVSGFGGRTNSSGYGVTYSGNVGIPYGSNIIEVSEDTADQYKYVAQFTGPTRNEEWTVVLWNKIGPSGALGGWYGNACGRFTVTAGQTHYVAFDEDSQGGWAAARGSSIPIDEHGGYASTWGEFDFGSNANHGWSGFDVSAIAAQNASLEVQGMKVCDVDKRICSTISKNAAFVHNAYTSGLADVGGIGGNLWPGQVRLAVTLDYEA